MKPRHALVLALTTGLALGCAAARAQDGQQPPAPPPDKPAPFAGSEDDRRRAEAEKERVRAAHEAVRAAEAKAADAKARLGELTEKQGYGPSHPSVVEARAALDESLRALESARAELHEVAPPEGRPQGPDPLQHRKRMEELHEQLRTAEARLTDARARADQLVKVEKKAADDPSVREAQVKVESAAAEVEKLREQIGLMAAFAGRRRAPVGHMSRIEGGPGAPGRHGGPGGPGGPGPSVEQRLEQLERAVREMHDMFERHHLAPEMRERAEQEMRARALGGPDTRPMQPGGPMGPGGPGGAPGGGAGGPGGPGVPRPPIARPGVQVETGGVQWDPRAMEEMRAQTEAKMQEAHKQIQAAQQRIDELSRQLADTQAALKKAQEELETLRPKK